MEGKKKKEVGWEKRVARAGNAGSQEGNFIKNVSALSNFESEGREREKFK